MDKLECFQENITKLKGSASIEVKQMADKLKLTDSRLVDLTIGEPCFSTPKELCEHAYKQMLLGDTHYVIGKGRQSLRKSILEVYRNNRFNDIEEVMITPGAKYAIYISLRTILSKGDSAMILDPSWVSYEQIINASGGRCIHVSLSHEENYLVDEDILEKYFHNSVKVLIINNPNNPTGRILKKEEMDAIVSFASKHGIWLIADEIYNKIDYIERFESFIYFREKYENIIIIDGFSKSFAMTGWRIGYCIAPKVIMDVIYKLFSHTITGVSGFIQEAANFAMQNGDYSKDMVDYYRRNKEYLVEKLKRIPGISYHKPEGSFYLWIKLDHNLYDFEDAALFLLKEKHIVGVSGREYGDQYKDFVRLSFAVKKEELEKAYCNLMEF